LIISLELGANFYTLLDITTPLFSITDYSGNKKAINLKFPPTALLNKELFW